LKKALWGTVIIGLVLALCDIGLRLRPTPVPIPESSKIYPYAIEVSSPEGQVTNFYGDSNSKDYTEIGKELGVTIYPEDREMAFPSFNLNLGSVIKITRAPEITINDWGKDQLYRSFAGTVGELIDEKQLDLGKDDRASVPLSTKVKNGMNFKITRVAVTDVDEAKPIDFKIINKNDPNLDEGKTRIGTAGEKGTMKLTYRVTRENGVQKSKVLINQVKTLDPVDQVVFVGTRPVITVRCNYNSIVIAAATKYSYSANKICNLMMGESHGDANIINSGGSGHYGLFQYDLGAWDTVSTKAGYGGHQWTDPTAQIMSTAWALTNGQGWRW
jgi:hypothetical protein